MGNKKYNQKAFVPIKGKCNFDKKLETESMFYSLKKLMRMLIKTEVTFRCITRCRFKTYT